MRLYIEDKNTGEKVHLQLSAKSREELVHELGSTYFNVNDVQYKIEDVRAEVGADSATVAALIGGFIGALGGAPGVIAGSAIGAFLGSGQSAQEKKEAELFNESST